MQYQDITAASAGEVNLRGFAVPSCSDTQRFISIILTDLVVVEFSERNFLFVFLIRHGVDVCRYNLSLIVLFSAAV